MDMLDLQVTIRRGLLYPNLKVFLFFRKKVSRLFTFSILNGHIIVTFMKINEYEYKRQWHYGSADGKSTERISDADGEISGKRILAYSPTGGFAR